MDSFSVPFDMVAKALRNVQSGLGGVMKPTGKVKAGSRSYEFLELPALLEAALPLFAENGLTLLHTQDNDGVDCILLHESGQWVKSRAQVGIDDSMGAQDIGSCYTYGKRYALQALLGLSAGDDDGAAATRAKKGKAALDPAPKPTPDVAIPWDDAEREAKFYATLEAGKVALSYPELVAICAEAGRPPPHKMDDAQLAKFTAYIVREHGSKAA